MSQRIARILGQSEREITTLISQLEEKNGWPSHDARFIAETIQNIRPKISQLGLDPDDTTAEELYHALQAKFAKSSRLFDLHFAAEDMDFNQKSAKAAQLISQNFEMPIHWALKNSVAKAVLRQLPPKYVMKQLSYRSIESLLKRENVSEIFLAAQQMESASWLKHQHRLVSKLSQTDFELRPIQIITLNQEKWGSQAGPDGFVAGSYEVCAIGLWPSPELINSSLLNLVLLLSEHLALSGHQKLSGVLAWWEGMDHLIAEHDGEHVSFNLTDNAMSSLLGHAFEDRQIEKGRHNFWQELVDRYQNRPPAEALFDDSVRQKLQGLKLKAPEPALEFAEDIDG